MKKRNLKSLELHKKIISSLQVYKLDGGKTGFDCTGEGCKFSEKISCYSPCGTHPATQGCVSDDC